MAKKHTPWNARSFVRPVTDTDGHKVDSETVVAVSDGHGRDWEVTVDDYRITSVRVFADDVKTEHLRSVPLVELRAAALRHVREVEELLDQGAHLDDALAEVEGETVALLPGGRITVSEFVEAWRAAGVPQTGPDGEAIRPNRRKSLSEKFSTTPWNIDKWTRYARDLGALDEARRPKPQTSGATAPDSPENGKDDEQHIDRA